MIGLNVTIFNGVMWSPNNSFSRIIGPGYILATLDLLGKKEIIKAWVPTHSNIPRSSVIYLLRNF